MSSSDDAAIGPVDSSQRREALLPMKEVTMSRNISPRRLLSAAGVGLAAIALIAGCTAPGPSSDEPVEITFWTWLPDIQKTVDLFEEAHPNISVTVENVGVGADQYTKIQNAVDAGSGGPDVAHMTYDAIPKLLAHRGAGRSDAARRGGHPRPVPAGSRRSRAEGRGHLWRAAGLRPRRALLPRRRLRGGWGRGSRDVGRLRRRGSRPPRQRPGALPHLYRPRTRRRGVHGAVATRSRSVGGRGRV